MTYFHSDPFSYKQIMTMVVMIINNLSSFSPCKHNMLQWQTVALHTLHRQYDSMASSSWQLPLNVTYDINTEENFHLKN